MNESSIEIYFIPANPLKKETTHLPILYKNLTHKFMTLSLFICLVLDTMFSEAVPKSVERMEPTLIFFGIMCYILRSYTED